MEIENGTKLSIRDYKELRKLVEANATKKLYAMLSPHKNKTTSQIDA